MVVRLGDNPSGRFLLPGAVPAGAGCVLVSSADRGVNVDLPGDQPGRVRPRLQQRQQPGPHTLPLAAPEQPIHGLPAGGSEGQGDVVADLVSCAVVQGDGNVDVGGVESGRIIWLGRVSAH